MTAVLMPLLVPLAVAAVSTMLGSYPRLRRGLSVAALTVSSAFSVHLLAVVADGSILVVHVGDWEWPLGITLVVDGLAAIMITVSSVMLLAVLVYAIGSPKTDDTRGFFHPVYLLLAVGVTASFVTGDLFNLFVAFEVMLTASYVLITYGARKEQVRHGISYIVISLVASTLFITAVGLVYAATGTVNMADLSIKLSDVEPALRTGLGVLFLVVFGIKAAIFPLFFWLPDSYPAAPSPVTAIFAGLLTKVGVYAIIRTQTLLFGDPGPSPVLLTVACLTMFVGVMGAVAQNDVKRILSFHIVSQIGYMIFGLGLFTAAGLAATVFYVVHHIIVKTTLFLVGGLIEEREGTSTIRHLGGLLHISPILAILFLLPALSLAGIPPLSGFVAKLALVQAGVDVRSFITVAIALLVSLFTLFSMTKIWAGVFWGKPEPAMQGSTPKRRLPRLMMAPTAALVVASLAFVVAAAPLYHLGETAANGLIDTSIYIAAVSGS